MRALLALIPLAGMLLGATSTRPVVLSPSMHYVISSVPSHLRLRVVQRRMANSQQAATQSVVPQASYQEYQSSSVTKNFPTIYPSASGGFIQGFPGSVKRATNVSPVHIPTISGSVGGHLSTSFNPSPEPSTSDSNLRTQSFDQDSSNRSIPEKDDVPSSEAFIPSFISVVRASRPEVSSHTDQANKPSQQHIPSSTVKPSTRPVIPKATQPPQQDRPSSTDKFHTPSVVLQAPKPSQQHIPSSTAVPSTISQASKPLHPQAPERNPICYSEIDVGTCRAALPRYYFDSKTGTCNCFLYGGCREGSEDEGPGSFITLEECQQVCRPPHKEEGPTCKEIFRDDHFVSFLDHTISPTSKDIDLDRSEDEYLKRILGI